MISYCTVIHAHLLSESRERAIDIGLVKLQDTIARLPDLEVQCVSMGLELPNAAAWTRYGLVVGALVKNLRDCICYCRFDVGCGCFLMIHASECSIWCSR